MHGGYLKGEYQNTLWAFDFKSLHWSKVKVDGTPLDARFGHMTVIIVEGESWHLGTVMPLQLPPEGRWGDCKYGLESSPYHFTIIVQLLVHALSQ